VTLAAPMPAPRAQKRAPPPLTRSQTAPVPSPNIHRANNDALRAGELGSDQEMDDDENKSIRSSICKSPSWTDHGWKKEKKERKRLEKERKEIKELEKRRKKDEDKRKAAEPKAEKRQNKQPPPAAMDTQKMPTGLRRNSIVSFISSRSTSQDNSRRSSGDEKRVSGYSFGSFKEKRSDSTPASSTELAPDTLERFRSSVGLGPPQLPPLPHYQGLGFHSRNGSSETDRSKSWGSDDAYQEALARYARKIGNEATAKLKKPIDFSKQKELEAFIAPNQTAHHSLPLLSRSRTDTDLMIIAPELKADHRGRQQSPPVKEKDTEDTKAAVKQEPGYNRWSQAPPAKPPVNGRDSRVECAVDRLSRFPATTSADVPPMPEVPPIHKQPAQASQYPDGSSYVHKSRMYHQQASIAGFQDEQAVKKANEQAVEDRHLWSEVAPSQTTPGGSAELVKQGLRTVSFQPGSSIAKEESFGERQPHTHDSSLHDSRDIVTLNRTQESSVLIPDKYRGFSRRKKPTDPRHNAGANEGNASSQDNPRSPSPKPKSSGNLVTRSAKDSKSEDTDKVRLEPSDGKNNSQRESALEAPNVFSHSRTRTASSQLFNDDLPPSRSSRPLPRSSTTPVLITTKHLPALPSEEKNATQPEIRRPFVPTVTESSASRPSSDSRVPAKAALGVVVEGVNGDTIGHKPSIKRHSSNPLLQSGLPPPSFDFLPPLKHQPLTKPKRASFIRSSTTGPAPGSTSYFPNSAPPKSPNADSSLTIRPHSTLRPTSPAFHALQQQQRPSITSRRHTSAPSQPPPIGSLTADLTAAKAVQAPVRKLFVICCKCKYWHDLPSELYEAMIMPKKMVRDDGGGGEGVQKEGVLDAAVKCPWCAHYMAKWCCEGWLTGVLMGQKMHP